VTWERLRDSYDTVAGRYEATFLDELAAKPADRDRLAGFAALVDDPVLDLGCGPGQIGLAVARAGRRVCGVDLSPAMAGLAAARLGGASAGDLRALPIRSGSVGGVVAYYSFIHLRREEQAAGWAEVARVLRPGGRFVASVNHPMRWPMPDSPDPEDLRVVSSYFDRRPYVETDDAGRTVYVEHHRTIGDRVRDVVAAGLRLVDLVEPEWPAWNTSEWGGWSPLRGNLIPGTAVFVCERSETGAPPAAGWGRD